MTRAIALAITAALLLGCPDKPRAPPALVAAATAEAVQQPEALTGGETWSFSNQGSKLSWVGAKLTGKHLGGFNTFTGSIQLVDELPTRSQVKVEIQMDSVFTDSEKLVGHLKSDDFFDVAKFPTATFVSSAIGEGGPGGASHSVRGVLTLHGVSRQVTFPASMAVGVNEVVVKAEFVINRKDFGIVYPGKPDNLISDDVAIALDVHAKK